MTSAAKVLVERSGPIVTVLINRPECRNAVDAETALLLRAAFQEFDTDEAVSVAVLSGVGGSFCAGYDLKSLAAAGMDYAPEGEGPMGPTRMTLSKPVIAAVEGYAVAGGLELALFADMRVVSATAVFGVFCRRWGVPLIDGGAVRLPRVVGHGRAMDMILTGRSVGAEEALSFGLANRVTPAGAARREAETLALEIARFPQQCMRADRMTAHQQWGQPLAEALRTEGVRGEAALHVEGVIGAGRFAGGLGRGGDFERL